MRESHVASDLVRAAGVVAVDDGEGRVRSMKVRIGCLSHVDPEALRHQIEWHAKGTVVEGCDLEIEEGSPSAEDRPDRHATDVVLVSIDVGR